MNTTQPAPTDVLKPNDPAVLKHVEMYQKIITRLAGNSSSCKNWCIVLVSAFLAFVVKDGKRSAGLLSLVPILVFWFLDGYYLALEQQFRAAFNEQMSRLRRNEFTTNDLFVVKADGRIPEFFNRAFFSWATWPVYLGLLFLSALVVYL